MRSVESVERKKCEVWKVQSEENEKKFTLPISHSPVTFSVTSMRNVENECV